MLIFFPAAVFLEHPANGTHFLYVPFNTTITLRCSTIAGYNITWHIRFGSSLQYKSLSQPGVYEALHKQYLLDVVSSNWSSTLTFLVNGEVDSTSAYCHALKTNPSLPSLRDARSLVVTIESRRMLECNL